MHVITFLLNYMGQTTKLYLTSRAAWLREQQIGPAMVSRQKRTEPATDRSQLELAILYRLSQATVHQHDVSSLLNEVLDIMETEMGMSRATLTLRRPDTDLFTIEASRGLSSAERKRGQYQMGEGVTGRVAKTAKPALVPDISQDAAFLDRTRTRKHRHRAFLCVPIIHRRQVIGYGLPPSLQTSDQTNTSILPPQGASLRNMVNSYEREIIIDALKKHRGNTAAAARELETTPRIIHYRIQRLGIVTQNYRHE